MGWFEKSKIKDLEEQVAKLKEELKEKNKKTIAVFGPINSREVYTFSQHINTETSGLGLYNSKYTYDYFYFETPEEAFNSSLYKGQSVTKQTLIIIDGNYFLIDKSDLVKVELNQPNRRVTQY